MPPVAPTPRPPLNIVITTTNTPTVSFAANIKPLFTPHDRDGMLNHCPQGKSFDLHDYDQVKARADKMLRELVAREMPKGGPAWDRDELQLFAYWINQGMHP